MTVKQDIVNKAFTHLAVDGIVNEDILKGHIAKAKQSWEDSLKDASVPPITLEQYKDRLYNNYFREIPEIENSIANISAQIKGINRSLTEVSDILVKMVKDKSLYADSIRLNAIEVRKELQAERERLISQLERVQESKGWYEGMYAASRIRRCESLYHDYIAEDEGYKAAIINFKEDVYISAIEHLKMFQHFVKTLENNHE